MGFLSRSSFEMTALAIVGQKDKKAVLSFMENHHKKN